MTSNVVEDVKNLTYLLVSVFYVVAMHLTIYSLDDVGVLDDSLLRGSFGNTIAAILAVLFEKNNASWKSSLGYMIPALVVPLLISALLKGGYSDEIFSMLCAVMISGFMLPVARLLIPIFGTLVQRKINRFRLANGNGEDVA